MVELLIEGYKVDLSNDTDISMNYTATELSNPTVIRNSFSKTVVLEGTKTNNKIFADIYQLDRRTLDNGGGAGINFDARKRTDFVLLKDGELIEEGYLQLDEINVNNGKVEYSITLYGGIGDFFYNLSYSNSTNNEYVSDGEQLTLADLYYGFVDDSGNTLSRSDEMEYKWKWDNEFIDEGWRKLSNHNESDMTFSNWITAIPTYNGYHEDFDNNKCFVYTSLMPSGATEFLPESFTADGNTYSTINDWGLCTMQRDMDEWEMHDLRSEYMRPAFKTSLIMNAISNPINNGGYEVVWDKDIYDKNTPLGKYFNYTYIMENPIKWEDFLEESEEQPTLSKTVLSGTSTQSDSLTITDEVKNSEISITISKPEFTLSAIDSSVYENKITTVALYGGYLSYPRLGGWIVCAEVRFSNTIISSSYNNVYFADETLKIGTVDFFGELVDNRIKRNFETFCVNTYGLNSKKFLYSRTVMDKTGYNSYKSKTDFQCTISIPSTYNTDDLTVIVRIIPFSIEKERFSNYLRPLELTYFYGVEPIGSSLERRLYSFSMSGNVSAVSSVLSDNVAFAEKFLNKKTLWGSLPTPFDYLVSFTKLFNMKYYVDIFKKRVYIMKNENFYIDDVVDISKQIDYSSPINIKPTYAESKWYSYSLEVPETYVSVMYDSKNKTKYGEKLYDTQYYFNSEINEIFDGNVYSNLIPYRLSSIFFNNDSNNRYIRPIIGTVFDWTLWKEDPDSSTNYSDSTITKYGWNYYQSLPNAYDCDGEYPKLCCFDEENGTVDSIDNALVFFDGFYKVATFPDSNNAYRLTNNIQIMSELNSEKPCHIYIDGMFAPSSKESSSVFSTVNIPQYYLPVFSKYLTDGNDEHRYLASLDFAKPTKTFIGDEIKYTDDITIYDQFWKNYINDIFNKDSKEITLSYFLKGNAIDAMRKFYYFGNSLWILNKITDYTVNNDEPTRCTFLKVEDRYNYTVNKNAKPEEEDTPAKPDVDEEWTYTYEILDVDYPSTVEWNIKSAEIEYTGRTIMTSMWGDVRVVDEELSKTVYFSKNNSHTDSITRSGSFQWHEQTVEWEIEQEAVPEIRIRYERDPEVFYAEVVWSATSHTFNYEYSAYTVYADSTYEFLSSDTSYHTIPLTANTTDEDIIEIGTFITDYLEEAEYEIKQLHMLTNNKIYYTSTDGNVVQPFNTTKWGANIISNTYDATSGGCITFDGEITAMPNSAFSSCKTLASIEIPDTVQNIRVNAFISCSALTSIEIPDSVETIGDSAFSRCTSLTSATIGSGCTSIGDYAFLVCSGLTSVNIPDGLETIGESAFESCSDLTSVIIPNSVQTIGKEAFGNCISLSSVTLGSGITRIEYSTFEHCNSLKTITIPDTVEFIGERAFFLSVSLESIYIGSGCTEIDYNGISYCPSLTSITITSPIAPNITEGTFEFVGENGWLIYPEGSDYSTWLRTDAYYLGYYHWNELPPITNKLYYTSTDGNVVQPRTTTSWGANIISNTYVDGVGCIEFGGDITAIPNSAFTSASTLETIIISDSVETINNRAFYFCRSLTSATIGSGCTSIGYYAFRDCDLTSINIPDSVETIGESAFYSCKSLTSATIGSGCTSIDDSAFAVCSGLTNITIPDSVETINNRAFYNCKSLTSVTIGSGCTSIGNYAFNSCSGLTNITIPDSVETIGNSVFYDCKSLSSVTIGSGCTSIGNYIFRNCTALTSIVISAPTAPTIDYYTFYSVAEYGTLIFPFGSDYSSWLSKNEYYLGYYHWNELPPIIHNKLYYTSTDGNVIEATTDEGFGANFVGNSYDPISGGCIEFDGDITAIPNSAFTSATTLETITIPDTVEDIKVWAFYSCTSLTSATIGSGCTSIGQAAFGRCTSLPSINIPNSVQTLVSAAFSRCGSLSSVIIGSGCTSIGNSAFMSCISLESIEIPDSVQTIGDTAFEGCSGLTSVSIGSGCTSIGQHSFWGCTYLSSIAITAPIAPTVQSDTFQGVKRNGVLKHPSGSYYASWMSTTSYYLGYYGWSEQTI